MTYDLHSPQYIGKEKIINLNQAILIQSISLIITIFLGMWIFFVGNIEIFYFVSLISGPIYSINLIYIFKMINNFEEHVTNELNFITSKISYFQQRMDRLPNYIVSNVTSLTYLISDERNDIEQSKISKSLLIISFLTPAWPISFCYIHYILSNKIQKHASFSNEIYQMLDEIDNNSNNFNNKNLKYEIKMQNIWMYTIISAISVLGFGLTFLIFGVGFFGIIWTLILILSINNHFRIHNDFFIKYSKKSNSPVNQLDMSFSKIGLPSKSLLILSFFCFGATAGFIAAFSNTLYMIFSVPLAVFHVSLVMIFVVSFIAPVVEENAKILFHILYRENLKRLPIYYWVLLGMVSGLGFALLEDYSYFQTFYREFSAQESLNLLLMRLLFPVHLLASATAGLGVGLWYKTKKFKYLVIFIGIAMFIHGSFNFIVSVGVK